jgi:hypothetical protein
MPALSRFVLEHLGVKPGQVEDMFMVRTMFLNARIYAAWHVFSSLVTTGFKCAVNQSVEAQLIVRCYMPSDPERWGIKHKFKQVCLREICFNWSNQHENRVLTREIKLRSSKSLKVTWRVQHHQYLFIVGTRLEFFFLSRLGWRFDSLVGSRYWFCCWIKHNLAKSEQTLFCFFCSISPWFGRDAKRLQKQEVSVFKPGLEFFI